MTEDNNKKNLLYFEAPTMRALYDQMTAWQDEHQKRLMSTHIERDREMFCCVALSNPIEVVIVGKSESHERYHEVKVSLGRLVVHY